MMREMEVVMSPNFFSFYIVLKKEQSSAERAYSLSVTFCFTVIKL